MFSQVIYFFAPFKNISTKAYYRCKIFGFGAHRSRHFEDSFGTELTGVQARTPSNEYQQAHIHRIPPKRQIHMLNCFKAVLQICT